MGRLRRLAGGFGDIHGLFGVLFGSLEASRGGLEASVCRLGTFVWGSLGDFWYLWTHFGHFVKGFWRLLATFYAVLGELLEKN